MDKHSTAAQHTPGRLHLIAEAARHQLAVMNYCDQSKADAARGKRHMAFWCLDMAASHRRRYVAARAAIAKAEGSSNA